LRISSGLVEWVEFVASSSVCPSAGALSTAFTPMTPLPPGRFSTTTGWPAAPVTCRLTSRAVMSAEPPGPKGATIFSGRVGKPCAAAGIAAPSGRAAAALRSSRRCIIVSFPCRTARRHRIGVRPAAAGAAHGGAPRSNQIHVAEQGVLPRPGSDRLALASLRRVGGSVDPFLHVACAPDGVAVVTMSSPAKRNALSDQSQYEEFEALARRVAGDHAIKAIVLTGAGTAFCAGGDVKAMRDRTGILAGSPYEVRNGYRAGIQRIPLVLYEIEVPTIAAVNGPAIGAGCDLACMCDIRIAAESARFAESFVKLGIVAGDGGAWLLPRAAGASMAAEMAFTGDPIDAAEALRCGLVSRVVPSEQLLEEAVALARRIAANPGHAVRMTKRLMREAQHMRLGSLLELSAAYQALAHETADHREAVAAMLEKRQPAFGGR
jgi:enoyl-CoA hydratase/carnithine racemase